MFKRVIVVRSGEEARRELNAFDFALNEAKLSSVTRQLLQEQIQSTLRQFEQQLTISSTHKLTADRLFEGDGYRVVVRVRSGSDSFLDKIKRLFSH